ncbi:MAG TPA: T9SS type A sorting domain-containing protein [Bacteroidetes bacterium]|nr:T9SS type A sorting domain-containing protein [Bacteroidota bacterium]
MKYRLLFFLTFTACQLFAQLTIKVTHIPSNTPLNASIFIAGNFQGWNPGDADYILDNNGDGTYQITISPPAGLLEFKFTRGSWDSVEGNSNGGFRPNREYNYSGNATTTELEIEGWEDTGGTGNSTAADNVHILDENFFMPQLNRSRRIWIYLPPDYGTSTKRYPVLYMHDGQNLFDVQTSFSGEWEVDESLNELFEQGDYGAIVVGIDNGGSLRTDELSPWFNASQNAGGEGGQYMDFIVETLKPFIDDNYRTLAGREFTCLFGSSLGGLISQYGLMEHQDVFGKAGVFSPAFWFNPEIFGHSENTPKTGHLKVYMLAGLQEGNGSVVEDVNQMETALFNNGFTDDEFNKAFHADGQHSEWYWAREFRWAYLWLFDGLDLTDASEERVQPLRVYPNPADSMVFIDNLPELKRPVVRLYDQSGRLVHKSKLRNNQIDVSSLQPGVYFMKIRAKRRFRFSEKIVVY